MANSTLDTSKEQIVLEVFCAHKHSLIRIDLETSLFVAKQFTVKCCDARPQKFKHLFIGLTVCLKFPHCDVNC